MTVEEAIAARYADDPALARKVLDSVRAFVALAEEQELVTASPCTVRVAF